MVNNKTFQEGVCIKKCCPSKSQGAQPLANSKASDPPTKDQPFKPTCNLYFFFLSTKLPHKKKILKINHTKSKPGQMS